LRFQRLAGGIGRQIDPSRGRQHLPTAEMIVKKEAEPDQPGRPKALVMREDESQGLDDVRRGAEQDFALQQRFAHEPKLIIFQIAQTAVNELG
jgi:hypothetical protein